MWNFSYFYLTFFSASRSPVCHFKVYSWLLCVSLKWFDPVFLYCLKTCYQAFEFNDNVLLVCNFKMSYPCFPLGFVIHNDKNPCLKVAFIQKVLIAFVISSNRWTLLFSWAWILNLWEFKGLKSCYISAWSGSEGSNRASFYYLSLYTWLRLLIDRIWVI